MVRAEDKLGDNAGGRKEYEEEEEEEQEDGNDSVQAARFCLPACQSKMRCIHKKGGKGSCSPVEG